MSKKSQETIPPEAIEDLERALGAPVDCVRPTRSGFVARIPGWPGQPEVRVRSRSEEEWILAGI